MAELQNTFMLEKILHLQALGNWPNAGMPVTALVTEYIPEVCKVPYDYLFRDDPVAMAECTLLVQEYLDLDILTANLDVYNFEAEAMGAKIKYYKDHCPDIDRSDYFIKDRRDLENIRFTDLSQGRFPYLIEYCRAYLNYVGIPTIPIFSAPWTLSGNLYGIDNLIMETIEDPDFVHEIQKRIVDDFHAPMYKALMKEIPGITEMDFVDAFASVPIVTVPIVEEFIRPYLQREKDMLGMPDIGLMDTAFFGTALLDGEEREKFEDFIIWSNGRFLCIDPDAEQLTPEGARKIATEKLTPLQIGVSATFLEFSTVDAIVAKVKEYCLKGKAGITPAIFFFNYISPKTPLENVKAAIQAVRIYGAADAADNTPFEFPAYQSFEDFLKDKIKTNREGYTFDWLKKSEYSYLAK